MESGGRKAARRTKGQLVGSARSHAPAGTSRAFRASPRPFTRVQGYGTCSRLWTCQPDLRGSAPLPDGGYLFDVNRQGHWRATLIGSARKLHHYGCIGSNSGSSALGWNTDGRNNI